MNYRTGEAVQITLDFQNRQCKLCNGVGEITLKREKIYVKIKYQVSIARCSIN